MSPRPSSDSAPFESRMVRESTLVASRKRHARRHIGLDEAGDDVDRGALRRQDQVDADSARHLRQPGDGFFDVGLVEHHQVGQFVDDDHDVGQRLFVRCIVEEAGRAVLKELVVLVDVAHAA